MLHVVNLGQDQEQINVNASIKCDWWMPLQHVSWKEAFCLFAFSTIDSPVLSLARPQHAEV